MRIYNFRKMLPDWQTAALSTIYGNLIVTFKVGDIVFKRSDVNYKLL